MATLVVTTPADVIADDGELSLREAIMAANGDITVDGVTGSGVDTITFAPGLAGTIDLDLGELGIANGSAVVINGDTNGDGKADITLSAVASRHFDLPSGASLRLESLTLTNGTGSGAGSIRVWSGASLTVINSTLASNTSDAGSGAISAGGNVTLINSTFSGNSALGAGGAIRVGSSGTTVLINTTLTDNTGKYGGAVSVAAGGQLHLYSSTISGNHATDTDDLGGGGLHVSDSGQAHLDNTIVAGNTAAVPGLDDVYTSGSGTILAHNSLLGTDASAKTTGTGNIFSDTPGLAALADNGGAVRTMALLPGSAALNAGSNAELPADIWDVDGDNDTAEALPVDGRGLSRAVGTTDIGAFENQAPTASAASATIEEDTTHIFTIADFGFGDADGDTLQSVTITSLPAKGALTLSGVAVAVNDVVPVAAIVGGLLKFTPAPNESSSGGPYAAFGFEVSDGISSSAASTFSITVTAVNDAPVITSNGGGATAAIAFAENATAPITIVTSSDVDAGSVRSYSIAGGADAARFQINATTGVLTFKSAPDFDAPADSDGNNVYQVIVRASDGSLFDDQTLSIAVTNVVGRTIKGTKGNDTINGKKPAGNAATNEEDRIDGKKGNDKLSGLGGNDTLIGGAGKDTLTGGAGADAFVFNAKLVAANADTIKDFVHDLDVIHLDDKIFKKIGPVLDAGEFYAKKGATKAHDKDDRIIYDKKTGKLYYDADGNKKGGVDAVHFATLSSKPALDADDFAIV